MPDHSCCVFDPTLPRRLMRLLALLPLLGLLAGAPAVGDEHEVRWINPDGGLFRDADNWDLGAWPTAGDVARFDIDATYTVNLGGEVVVDALRFTAGDVAFDQDEHVLRAAGDASPGLIVGDATGETATLRVQNGDAGYLDIENAETRIGNHAGATGTLIAKGPQTRMQFGSQPVHVGYAGTGTLVFDDGAYMEYAAGWIGLGTTATGHGTLIVRDSGYDLDTFPPTGGVTSPVTVGEAGTGQMTVEEGGRVHSGMYIGREAGSEGQVTVTGADEQGQASRLEGTIRVRWEGQGSLIVEEGGSLHTRGDVFSGAWGLTVGAAAGAEGEVVVRGEQTIWTGFGGVEVGFSHHPGDLANGGEGTLLIEDGATVSLSSALEIASGSGSQGHVSIRRAGTNVTTGQLNLGATFPYLPGGRATLLIEDGASVESGGAGSNMGVGLEEATAIVRGQGSVWHLTATSDFHGTRIGWGSHGELVIEDGGTVINRSGQVGISSAGTGSAIVTGLGSTWINHANLLIGRSGASGTVDVTNHGRISVAKFLQIGENDSLNITTGGAVAVGALDDDQNLHALPGNALHVGHDGNVSGHGAISVATLHSAGRVTPGTPRDDDDAPVPGTLSLEGDYDQHADGTLHIVLASDRHGELAITGSAALAGTLAVELADDGSGVLGQAVDVLSAAGVVGSFDEVLAVDRDDLFVHAVYSSTDVTITLGLVGDMNADAVLDAGDVADFVLALTDPAAYEAQHGLPGTLPGDVNDDGVLDAVDVAPFVELLVGAGAASVSVPEPGAASTLAISSLMLLRRRRCAPMHANVMPSSRSLL